MKKQKASSLLEQLEIYITENILNTLTLRLKEKNTGRIYHVVGGTVFLRQLLFFSYDHFILNLNF